VALQFGPMSLLLMRSTLRSGWTVGLAVAAGVAVIDGAYAAVGALGVAPALALPSVRLVLGVAGAVVLVTLGARSLWSALRVRLGGETPGEVASPARAFRLALGVVVGSLTWMSLLATGMAAARRRIGPRAQRAIDVLAGVGLIGFGGAIAYSSVERR